jgi:CRISPR-associated Csx3 family protein
VALKVQDVIIDLSTFYTSTAKLSELDSYIQKARDLAGNGNEVVLTGQSPVWLYLKIAHALHGKARKLIYRSPVTGAVVIFDHSPD